MLRAVVGNVNAVWLKTLPSAYGVHWAMASVRVDLGFWLEMYTALFFDYEASNRNEKLRVCLWFWVMPNSTCPPLHRRAMPVRLAIAGSSQRETGVGVQCPRNWESCLLCASIQKKNIFDPQYFL